ncbi:MAG TPA: UvrD-helicase domain-containing protein [Dehalococcoidia bacterium]|nr:UvrD-helicase domain-containing protein [Dehalococcoidia bacterium]
MGQIARCYNRLVDILEGLNPAQREAVTWVEGPLLIIAGPGSGKTAISLGLAQGWQGRGKKIAYLRLGPSPEGDVSFAQRLGLEAASCPPAEVEQAYNRLAQGRDLVLIEGLVPEVEMTLKKLRGRVLLVLPFKGVERAGEAAGRLGEALVGAVLSMVPRSRMEKAKKELAPALKGKKVAVLGFLPEERALLAPSVADLAQYLGARVVWTAPLRLDRRG